MSNPVKHILQQLAISNLVLLPYTGDWQAWQMRIGIEDSIGITRKVECDMVILLECRVKTWWDVEDMLALWLKVYQSHGVLPVLRFMYALCTNQRLGNIMKQLSCDLLPLQIVIYTVRLN